MASPCHFGVSGIHTEVEGSHGAAGTPCAHVFLFQTAQQRPAAFGRWVRRGQQQPATPFSFLHFESPAPAPGPGEETECTVGGRAGPRRKECSRTQAEMGTQEHLGYPLLFPGEGGKHQQAHRFFPPWRGLQEASCQPQGPLLRYDLTLRDKRQSHRLARRTGPWSEVS